MCLEKPKQLNRESIIGYKVAVKEKDGSITPLFRNAYEGYKWDCDYLRSFHACSNLKTLVDFLFDVYHSRTWNIREPYTNRLVVLAVELSGTIHKENDKYSGMPSQIAGTIQAILKEIPHEVHTRRGESVTISFGYYSIRREGRYQGRKTVIERNNDVQ